MYWYAIKENLMPLENVPAPDMPAVLLLDSDELAHAPALSGLDKVLHHVPYAHDVKVCKAELRRDCITGTLLIPQAWKHGEALACGYLITPSRVVIVDDTDYLLSKLHHIIKTKARLDGSVGRFIYCLIEQIIARDLHHLEEIEDQAQSLEEKVLSGELDNFNGPMANLRKEVMARFRYYSQLDDVAFIFQDSADCFFSEKEQMLFRMLADRIVRLREESQLLREYCGQIQSLFQSEIDIRQNRIMQVLTIVTTVFMPLSLLAGWYGMNFVGMPELSWKYGYPAMIIISVVFVVLSIWICRKKKFL